MQIQDHDFRPHPKAAHRSVADRLTLRVAGWSLLVAVVIAALGSVLMMDREQAGRRLLLTQISDGLAAVAAQDMTSLNGLMDGALTHLLNAAHRPDPSALPVVFQAPDVQSVSQVCWLSDGSVLRLTQERGREPSQATPSDEDDRSTLITWRQTPQGGRITMAGTISKLGEQCRITIQISDQRLNAALRAASGDGLRFALINNDGTVLAGSDGFVQGAGLALDLPQLGSLMTELPATGGVLTHKDGGTVLVRPVGFGKRYQSGALVVHISPALGRGAAPALMVIHAAAILLAAGCFSLLLLVMARRSLTGRLDVLRDLMARLNVALNQAPMAQVGDDFDHALAELELAINRVMEWADRQRQVLGSTLGALNTVFDPLARADAAGSHAITALLDIKDSRQALENTMASMLEEGSQLQITAIFCAQRNEEIHTQLKAASEGLMVVENSYQQFDRMSESLRRLTSITNLMKNRTPSPQELGRLGESAAAVGQDMAAALPSLELALHRARLALDEAINAGIPLESLNRLANGIKESHRLLAEFHGAVQDEHGVLEQGIETNRVIMEILVSVEGSCRQTRQCAEEGNMRMELESLLKRIQGFK